MARPRIVDEIKRGRILVSDGAWGTFLHKKGLKLGECPEIWCLERPEDVLDIAKRYVAAGADMIETNSFGATRIKLRHYGLDHKAAELNEAAAAISRKAAGDAAWVIASIGPTGKMLAMGDVTEDEMYEAFREQAAALERGGADAACIETMSDATEACLAIKAVKENTSLEIMATFTFDKTQQGWYRTMMGLSPEDAALAAVEAGAQIIGTNCGNGTERMVDIVRIMRRADPKTPILVQANAGLPVTVDGRDVFPESPETMAALVPALIEAGANVIGGCCGTTPEHIAAIRRAVDTEQSRRKTP
jgi:5-methyltetrahydrofolate--homocysteine methyltransferase